ncbi:MAG: hypothetical protein KJO22_05730 [Bacteroidia bacterium]|nr:hypothetical protein [Bacteroidia bacterium]
MIKFFRQIRQSMINQNRTKKYLLYAVGEIILVVIGILIALQINTWNTTRLDNIKEREYLTNLLEDIKAQHQLVKDQVVHNNLMRLKCEKAIRHLNSNSINADSINLYLTDITRKTFVVSDPTFQDLKSSGNILLIKNGDLRKKILTFYQYLDYSALVIQISNEKTIAEFRDLLVKENIVDMNYTDSLTVAGGIDFSLKTTPLLWAKKLQEDKFKDRDFLFMVLNHIGQRGRTSSVNLDLMKRMEIRIENMQNNIENYLN